MAVDSLTQIKSRARETWTKGSYGELANRLLEMSAHLVRAVHIGPQDRVLDVATGTGITAITARQAGAGVVGVDLTPRLLHEAQELAASAGMQGIEWREADAEALPFRDAEFDVVLSSFGHMFAPRPEVTIREMLRVLRPEGRIAFTTWPPEHATGAMFRVLSLHTPPPAGVPSPLEWGIPPVVQERLGDAVEGLVFERGAVRFHVLSPHHYWTIFSRHFGPTVRAIEAIGPDRVVALSRDYVNAILPYFRDNTVFMDYLLTRAIKRAT